MNELTTVIPSQPATLTIQPSPASEVIHQTAKDLDNAYRIASALVQTAFAPRHFHGKPEEGAAAILYGATIGMDPLAALQNLYVIGGKPALYARAMVAVVMSKGHELWTVEESEGKCTVAGRRKGTDKTETVTWTTEDAKRAGYTSNKKYQTDPRAMLYARASGDVARRIAPDALLGMAHNAEELMLENVGADKPATVRVSAADFTTAPEPEQQPDAAEAMTDRTRKRMFALFNEHGITDATQQRKGMSAVLGRTVKSRAELSEVDAQQVIAALEARTTNLPEPNGEPTEDTTRYDNDQTLDGWPEAAVPGGAA